MDFMRRHVYTVVLLFIVLSVLAGCTSNATRLASVKANYNEGKWGYVLGDSEAEGTYSADDVIEEAANDTYTADQAKLIKARALMHRFMEDKLPAGVAPETDPDMQEALRLLRELYGKSFDLNWMNVEMMAAAGDYLYAMSNYFAAFDAYSYLLDNANWESLGASHRQYIRRWFEVKYQLDGIGLSKTQKDYINDRFKKTFKKVARQHPDDINVIKASIIILGDKGNPRAAVQRAMFAYFVAIRNPKTQKYDIEQIDGCVEEVLGELPDNDPEKDALDKEYDAFRGSWNATWAETPL